MIEINRYDIFVIGRGSGRLSIADEFVHIEGVTDPLAVVSQTVRQLVQKT